MSIRSYKYLLLAAPFLLSACGEGYEMVVVDTSFPYGNERTAGSGVAYVLKKMAPERELNLEPAQEEEVEPTVVEEPPAEPVEEVVPPVVAPPPQEEARSVETFEEVFEKSQRK